MLSRPPLDVAIAVIQREGQLLISQRMKEDSFGGFWEFPGGKLEIGETMEQGLEREIQEELGIQILVKAKLMVIEHKYPGRVIRLHCYDCQLSTGEPKSVQCAACKWVWPHELDSYQFPPASGPLIKALQKIKASA